MHKKFDRDAIISMAADGKPYGEIAAVVGCSLPHVSAVAIEAGIQRRPRKVAEKAPDKPTPRVAIQSLLDDAECRLSAAERVYLEAKADVAAIRAAMAVYEAA